MKITVCIGSSCHMKGSRTVVEKLKDLVFKNGLSSSVDIVGTFCMGNCQKGVCVDVDGKIFSVTPDSVEEFFDKNVLARR